MKNLLYLIIIVLAGVNFYVFYNKSQPVETYWYPPTQIVAQSPVEIKIEPEWTEYLPIQKSVDLSLGAILADIESHMPKGHQYRDSDRITWGHETSHGIASQLRQKFGMDGFYCLQDRAVLMQKPNVTIRQVASMVPASLRGKVYQLYLVQQQQHWNNDPLYIFDEWIAYTNGCEVRTDLGVEEQASTVEFTFEFNVYSIALAKVVQESQPDYDDKQFKALLMWNLERSMDLYRDEPGAKAYWSKFMENQDAEGLRKFARDYFGEKWCSDYLGI